MNAKEKIRFILVFFVSYFLFLAIGVFIFGNILVGLEEKLIFWLLQNHVNYEAFDFVVYCSGIVSISAYLGVVIGLLAIKIKPDLKVAIASTIFIWVINILRIIVVMLSDILKLANAMHVFSWFFMAGIIIWVIKISYDRRNRKNLFLKSNDS